MKSKITKSLSPVAPIALTAIFLVIGLMSGTFVKGSDAGQGIAVNTPTPMMSPTATPVPSPTPSPVPSPTNPSDPVPSPTASPLPDPMNPTNPTPSPTPN